MKKKFLFSIITWIIVTILSLIFYSVATNFFIFPSKYKYPLLLFVLIVVTFTGILSILLRNKGKAISITLNIILIIILLIGTLLLPNIEKRIRNVFKNVSTDKTLINIYAFNDNVYDDFKQYDNSTFITQSSVDLANQQLIVDDIKSKLENITITKENDIISALETFYNNRKSLLILNESFVDSIEEINGYTEFSQETKIIYTYVKEEIIVEPNDIKKDITNEAFTVYIAGTDSIRDFVSLYGRTDVDILMTVNPINKQIMIVSLPRDTYLPNPAQNDNYDKLTHLGNNSIFNTIEGVSDYLDIDIQYYVVVNFSSFIKIIDTLKGIDIDNPYRFTGGSLKGTYKYLYEEGNIHLDGDQALTYARERKTLSEGDFDRNKHQTIIIKALINKLTSLSSVSRYSELLNVLSGQFLTNIHVDDIYKLIGMQIDDNEEWDIITYNLGGIGDMLGTSSMGMNRPLYVVHLFESQVTFIQEEMNKIVNNEMIKQETLPNDGDSHYIPN